MKKRYLSKIITFLFFALCSILYLKSQSALADNNTSQKRVKPYKGTYFEKGYFMYELNTDRKSVSITGYTDNVRKSTLEADKLIVPSEVTYNNYTYPVTTVEDLSFHSSKNKYIIISEGIQEIYLSFFHESDTIEKIRIPASVKKIHCENIGAWRNSVKAITVAKRNPYYKSIGNVIYEKDGKTLVCAVAVSGEYIVEEGVTRIGPYAFFGNASLTGVILPVGLTSIEGYAFAGCPIEDIVIPSSVTMLGEGVFQGASDLSEIYIPSGIKEVKKDTFSGCTSLERITVSEGVEIIGKEAFAYCSSVTGISLPGTLRNFDQTAFDFDATSQIMEVALPENNIYFKLVDGAILSQDGTILYKVITGKKEYTVPSGVKYIMERAFSNNLSLDTVTISNGITKIPASCFESSSVKQVKLPSTIDVIEENAFLNSGLSQINLPEGLKSIEKGAFQATQAESFTFPSTLKYIGAGALGQAEGDRNLQFFGKKTPKVGSALGNTTISQALICSDVVYVPQGRQKAYKSALQDSTMEIKKIREFTQKKLHAEANEYAQIRISFIAGDDMNEYAFSINGEDYKKSAVFNSVEPGKEYTVYAKKGNTVLTTKVQVPSMIYWISDTQIRVVPAMSEIDGYEYRIDDGSWTTEVLFENLAPNTEYILYRRKISEKAENKNKVIKEKFCTMAE